MQFSIGDSIIVNVSVGHFETYDSILPDEIMAPDIIMNPLVENTMLGRIGEGNSCQIFGAIEDFFLKIPISSSFMWLILKFSFADIELQLKSS